MDTQKSFSTEILEQGIAVVSINIVAEKQNTLRAEFAAEINQLLDELEQEAISGIIITSGKQDSFIVGADINMLSSMQSIEQIRELTKAGYAVFNRLEELKIPVVAEIHGACMGGGLELVLACHGRVCSNHPATVLALPEVQLGLLPGGGGTQRLPALIGVAEALAMMTTGMTIRPHKALKLGLVDDVTEQLNLRQASINRIQALNQSSEDDSTNVLSSLLTAKGWQSLLLEKNQLGLNFLFQQARKKVLAKTQGNYPAPERIIDCVEAWSTGNSELGYESEASSFAELVLSPEAKQLIHLFFAVTELKKHRYVSANIKTKAVEKLLVLGAGLMGAGIALVSADKTKASVRIKDVSESGVNHGLKYAWQRLQTRVKKRHFTHQQALEKMARITAGTDYTGFAQADLVIEAVFESLELKQQMLKEVETHCGKDTIFATNTSSIPITEIAAKAKRPKNVIGMHYFSPVEKMPLLEVVVTDKTAQKTIATVVDFGRLQGKTVIVVNDGAGFYTSRVLAAYMNEAGHLIAEGISIEAIDAAMTKFGYPVGPITLLDEVGIDVGTKIMPILEQAFGERMKPADAFINLIEAGRQGRKNNKGFYDYTEKVSAKRPVDQSVYQDLGVQPTNKMDPKIIAERCNLMLLNEAIRCLHEGVLQSPRDGDIGAIFGLGYPAYLGGPFRYADAIGIDQLIERLKHYQDTVSARFKAADVLLEMANKGQTFY